MATTPKLGVRLMATNDVQKEVVFNEAAVVFDTMVARAVKAVGVNAPPPAPQPGDAYIVGSAPTGDWSGKASQIALFFNGWRFYAPTQKMKFFDEASGKFWTYSGAAWAQDAAGTPTVLSDLADVGGAAPEPGDLLAYDPETGWSPQAPAPQKGLSELPDVDIDGLTGGQTIAWDPETGKWVNAAFPAPSGDKALADLTDVDTSGVGNGDILIFSGGKWRAAEMPEPNPPYLDDLADVVISNPKVNDVLVWNGLAWGPASKAITYSFVNMIDGPRTFEGNANKFLVVDNAETEMVFKSVDELFQASAFKLQSLGDVPAPDDVHLGKYLRLKKSGSTFSYEYVAPTDTQIAFLADGESLTARLLSLNFKGFAIEETTEGHVVVTARNALEFQADGEPVDGDDPYAINFKGGGVGVTNIDGVVTVTINTGGGSLGELDDVDLSTQPTDKQALVYDALAGQWKPGDGVATIPRVEGVAEPATYEMGPFAPPTAAMFPLRHNSPAASLTEVKNRGLVVQPGPQTSGIRHAAVTRKLSNDIAPWVITARVVPNSYFVTGHAGGIVLQRSANGALVFLNLGRSTGDTQSVVRFGHVSAAGVETITLSKATEYNWLRLDYDGNDIRARISADGLIWMLFGTLSAAAVLGGPPDRIGVENRSNASHGGEVGTLVTYWDDPDFPAAARTRQGFVSLSVGGLTDVDLDTAPPTGGQALVWDAALGLWVPGSVASSDIPTYGPGEAGKVLAVSASGDSLEFVTPQGGGSGGGAASEFDIAVFLAGTPDADNIAARYIVARPFRLVAGLGGSFAYAERPADSNIALAIQRNGEIIGAINFAMGANAATLDFADTVLFDAGDRLDVVTPVSVASIADIAITFAGSRE